MPDPRSIELSSRKWPQNCPLDRKQGLVTGGDPEPEEREAGGRQGKKWPEGDRPKGGCGCSKAAG